MGTPGQSFRDFEQTGWEDAEICARYHEQLATATQQSIGALLDAAGVGRSSRVLDVATGAGYVAAAAARRGAEVSAVDFSAKQIELARQGAPGSSSGAPMRSAPASAARATKCPCPRY
jgi:cyclopropane fatty-acyl-phospholipid synthase-like methyltransferase